MASEKKKRKLKNSYCVPSTLKNKLPQKCKRLLFYTSSQRQQEKWEIKRKLLTEWSKSFIDKPKVIITEQEIKENDR